jgi:pyruvate kinase
MNRRKTKIVATIGPASEKPDVLAQLISEGVDVIRLNFSHGSHEEHGARIDTVRKVSAKVGKPVAIVCDLQGPKIRIGKVPSEGIQLSEGAEIIFDASTAVYQNGNIPLPSPIFLEGTHEGDLVYLDDGTLQVRITKVVSPLFHALVVKGGVLTSNKGVNVPDLKLSRPILEDKDKSDLKYAVKAGVDYIALSFIRNAEDIREARKFMKNSKVKIIAKVERPEALANIDEIVAETDAVMVARGDLGVETPIWALPVRQKEIIDRCRLAGKPVIVATQMLDSMIRNPIPTRAEVSDVANAVYDSADAVMLSGESANGKYPLETVSMMRHILEETESHQVFFGKKIKAEVHPVTQSLAKAAKYLVSDLNAKFIFAGTSGGSTAYAVSQFRPKVPVVALTSDQMVANQLALAWGVVPMVFEKVKKVTDLPGLGIKQLTKKGQIAKGDKVIFISGLHLNAPGETNNLSVLEV